MTYKPYLVSNYRVGLERDLAPWLLPQDAFPELLNAFLYRGVINRRGGSTLLGRLVTNYTDTLANHTTNPQVYSGTLAHPPIVIYSVLITDGLLTYRDNGLGQIVNSSGVLLAGSSINYTTGAYSFELNAGPFGSAVTVDYDKPANNPVMGLRTRELTTINAEDLIAFDTTQAYRYSSVLNKFTNISGGTTWTGSNSDFFWSMNYRSAFWATNNVDNIRWYTNLTTGTTWVTFTPLVHAAVTLDKALMIFAYKDRVVVLNTTESSVNYPQRARWSQNGTPYYNTAPGTLGVNVDAWRDDIIGRGGFIDAPTAESIVSAWFVNDTLIVFFEASTYQLRYTGNEFLPFIWEKINAELGSESTFSVVGMDKGIFAVGQNGIIASNSNNVLRIDQIIPDEVFNFENGNNGLKRVHGIRDFFSEKVYWTYGDSANNPTFPNKMLCYNYIDKSYSIFDNSYTCFGYYRNLADITWADLPIPWSTEQTPWNSSTLQSDFPQIVAGNQQGFVFFMQNADLEYPLDEDFSLNITGITAALPVVVSVANHNLQNNDVILISNVAGMTEVNDVLYRISTVNANSFVLLDEAGHAINGTAFTAYISGGYITRVPNFSIATKRLNPFISQGIDARLGYVDIFFSRASGCNITAELYVDDNYTLPVQSQIVSLTYLGFDQRFWSRVYLTGEGQFFQVKLKFSTNQLMTPIDADGIPWRSLVQVHGMIFHFAPAGRLMNFQALT